MAGNKKVEDAAPDAEAKAPEASKAKEHPAVEACRKAIALMDPNGKRHVPSGTPGAYQEALNELYAAVDAEG